MESRKIKIENVESDAYLRPDYESDAGSSSICAPNVMFQITTRYEIPKKMILRPV